ncbi:MAG: thiamine-binding protein [Burkholderiaceae bacterium]|nr:thiamine-binding protein [Microbacteriaceae bacterium]
MLVAFSVAPSGTPADVAHSAGTGDDASVHSAVAAAVRVVRESGLPNHTDAMFTTIEGEWQEVFEVIRLATEAVGAYGSRVSLVLKADIRPGHTGELAGKIERLERAIDAAGQ